MLNTGDRTSGKTETAEMCFSRAMEGYTMPLSQL